MEMILLANTIDPDQTPHNMASDLGLHCLLKAHIIGSSVPLLIAFIFLCGKEAGVGCVSSCNKFDVLHDFFFLFCC